MANRQLGTRIETLAGLPSCISASCVVALRKRSLYFKQAVASYGAFVEHRDIRGDST